MTGFSDNTGASATYTYHSDGLRASKTTGGDTFRYYYNGQDVINETKNNANYATNTMGVDGIISRTQSGTAGYMFHDAHGDITAVYNTSKGKLADYTYDAWGNQTAANTSAWSQANPVRYNGQYYDAESGMTYLRARYYDSSIQRFITEDPAKDGMNWYSYCSNNPVMYVDPMGLGDVPLRPLATDNYGARVEWDGDSRTATVSFSNGISYTFTANPNDDDGAYIGDDGVMYVSEEKFQEKLRITSHDVLAVPEMNLVVILNVFDNGNLGHRMELSLNGVVRYSGSSKKNLYIKNVQYVTEGDVRYMNGYAVNDFIDVYSGIQVEAGFLNEILNFPQMLSYRDIRVDLSNNDRYFFEGDSQAFIYASQYIFLYCF